MPGCVVVVALPGGSVGAFTPAEIADARKRAAELGFGANERSRQARDSLNEPAKLLDSKALGNLLGIDSTTAEAMARDGRLPSIRIGRLLRFEPAACIATLRVSDGRL